MYLICWVVDLASFVVCLVYATWVLGFELWLLLVYFICYAGVLGFRCAGLGYDCFTSVVVVCYCSGVLRVNI